MADWNSNITNKGIDQGGVWVVVMFTNGDIAYEKTLRTTESSPDGWPDDQIKAELINLTAWQGTHDSVKTGDKMDAAAVVPPPIPG